MKATKIKVTRCYLIQILDKDDNELDADFCFLSRKEAKQIGEKMKNKYNEKQGD